MADMARCIKVWLDRAGVAILSETRQRPEDQIVDAEHAIMILDANPKEYVYIPADKKEASTIREAFK